MPKYVASNVRMNKAILIAVLLTTIGAINAIAGRRDGATIGRAESVSGYTRKDGTVVQPYTRRPAGSGSATDSSSGPTKTSYAATDGYSNADDNDGIITLLYYNASELADRATYKANIKSGKWHAFKNGE